MQFTASGVLAFSSSSAAVKTLALAFSRNDGDESSILLAILFSGTHLNSRNKQSFFVHNPAPSSVFI
jgi:hypothetical protein